MRQSVDLKVHPLRDNTLSEIVLEVFEPYLF